MGRKDVDSFDKFIQDRDEQPKIVQGYHEVLQSIALTLHALVKPSRKGTNICG